MNFCAALICTLVAERYEVAAIAPDDDYATSVAELDVAIVDCLDVSGMAESGE